MKKIYKAIFLVILCFCGVVVTQAQNKPALPIQAAANKKQSVFIKFSPSNKATEHSGTTIEHHLGFDKDSKLIKLHTKADKLGFTQELVQQYYKGIKVEYGTYKVMYKNGVLNSIHGEKYNVENVNTQPSLTEEEALQKALQYVGAHSYKWQIKEEEQWLKVQEKNSSATYFPSGELVFCSVSLNTQRVAVATEEIALAYKFDIYAHEPLSRAYIYVSAHNGNIVHTNAIIKHATGIAATRYSSSRNISTEKTDTSYLLRDYSRGAGIETYDLKNSGTYLKAVDFQDKDNNWSAAEFDNAKQDNAALDAHWGAMMTYDYFKNVHGRNSFDGNGRVIRNYVHYSRNYANAFWNGSFLTYGDGGIKDGVLLQPFTTLDIVAHEIGHAICDNTAQLVYRNESGALNEGFSDIWAATIENYADPAKNMWLMGEEVNVVFRSMSEPNEYEQPDTYKGKYWYTGIGDNGGVHINSGVLNHLFYLLSVGKSGVNDNGDAYTVTGITVEKAAKIAYRTESTYLTANSTYADARKFSIQAATDLFGANSKEALQTAQAWYAVGVYETEEAPSDLTATAVSATQIQLSWKDNATAETGYVIERSLYAGKGFVQVASLKANTTTYSDINIPSNAVYYYRIRAQFGSLNSAFSSEASVVLGYATIAMSNNKLVTCQAVFVDPGLYNNYANGDKLTMTLSPSAANSKLSVVFSSFDLENFYDYLIIFDGANTSAPYIGKYTGTSLPPVITASNAEGKLTFYFVSDEMYNKTGWIATINCISTTPPAPVITDFAPKSGTPGSSILITGANFNGATAVQFNETPAEFIINSDTQITAIVPATASRGNITISTQAGTQHTTTSFTVTPIINLSGLTYTFDSKNKEVTVQTIPVGLPVNVLYNNSASLPVNAGIYKVTATVATEGYEGIATDTLIINKAEAQLVLERLTQTYTGAAIQPVIITTPAGLPVSLMYDSIVNAPVNTGSYQIIASINDINYIGSSQATLRITKATAMVTLTDLQHTYNGTARKVIATTAPAGLAVTVTYNTMNIAPVNAGSYSIVAFIEDKNYEGNSTGVMLVNKATQVINFDELSDKTFGDAGFAITASATSQLPVTFSVVQGMAVISKNVVNLTGPGQLTIRVSQAGNDNFMPAVSIERTICVNPAKPAVTSSATAIGSIFTLTSSSITGNQWLLNGQPIEGATSQTLEVTNSGNYSVIVTSGICQNISDEVTLTGYQPKAELSAGIQIYPNPATDRIMVNLGMSDTYGETIAVIYNILGEQVAQQTLNQQTNGWQTEFTVSHLPAGRYIVQLTNGQQRCTKTFIKY